MIDSVAPADVLAEIKMVRNAFPGTILVTEGGSDCKFFRSLLSMDKVYLLPAHGKSNVVGCIKLSNGSPLKGILGMIDSDHDRILKKLPEVENLVSTDFHDCEMLMIVSDAFENVIDEYASPVKLKKLIENNLEPDIRALLFRVCAPVGALRLISRKNKWNLKFTCIDFKKFIDTKALVIDLGRLVNCVLANTKGHTLAAGDVLDALNNELAKDAYDSEQLCGGHDFTTVLGIGLRRAFGSLNKTVADRGNIEKMLRLAYEFKFFKRTKCFGELDLWTKRNSPFSLF